MKQEIKFHRNILILNIMNKLSICNIEIIIPFLNNNIFLRCEGESLLKKKTPPRRV